LLKRLKPRSFDADDDLLSFGQHKQNALPNTIRCLVWNMLKAKRRQWWTDFHHLTVDRDLVLLQEAVANSPTDSLFNFSSRHHWLMARSHEHPISGVVTGVKTGCIAKPLASQKYLSPHREPLIGTQKAMLSTQYAIDDSNERLLVLNLHAINFVKVAKFQAHMGQVGEAIGGHTGPDSPVTSILGDGQDERTFKRLRRSWG